MRVTCLAELSRALHCFDNTYQAQRAHQHEGLMLESVYKLQYCRCFLSHLQKPTDQACCLLVAEYLRHPMYGGLLMASLGLAAVTHDESRLLAAAVLWLVLEQKVSRGDCQHWDGCVHAQA